MSDTRTHMDEAELRALHDPWIDWFIDRQARLLQELKTDDLMHMAGSFGKPGSMTEGGQRFKVHSLELDLHNKALMLYALAKGYMGVEEIGLTAYDKPPTEKP